MPNYSDRDPKGWCGDPRRGAALGRTDWRQGEPEGKLTLRHIRLDNGGYDNLGTYWGVGERLYWCADDGGNVDFNFRARDRESAKEYVRETYYPNARFFR